MQITGKFFILPAIYAISLLLSSCAQIQELFRADPPEYICSFLPRHELLERQEASAPFHYLYQAPRPWPEFKYIYVPPADMSRLLPNENWAKLDEKAARKFKVELNDISRYLTEKMREAFSTVADKQGMTMVEHPDKPGTLVVASAITRIIPTKTELNYLSIPANYFLPGISTAVLMSSGGSICIEGKLYDSRSRKIIMMFADRERNQAALIDLSAFTWYGSAKVNIDFVSRETAAVFSALPGEKVGRGAPVRLINSKL